MTRGLLVVGAVFVAIGSGLVAGDGRVSWTALLGGLVLLLLGATGDRRAR